MLSQSPELVAPHGSSEAVFGTNPIGVGVPADGGPLVLDMATSAFAYYALIEHSRAGLPVPGDVGYGADGAATTDPAAILDGGALRSFDRRAPRGSKAKGTRRSARHRKGYVWPWSLKGLELRMSGL